MDVLNMFNVIIIFICNALYLRFVGQWYLHFGRVNSLKTKYVFNKRIENDRKANLEKQARENEWKEMNDSKLMDGWIL